ncbi:MAG: GDP-mannose 4,6-dehydratase [Patescibacteria group bacterium]
MNDQTILITGGTGFAGSHLVEELLARGFSKIFVTSYGSPETFVHTLLPAEQIVTVDLTNQDATFDLIKNIQPTWVFHLASIATTGTSFGKAATIFQNNIGLQLNLLEAIKVHALKARVLVVGSGMEYGMTKYEDIQLSSNAHLDELQYPEIDEEAPLNPTNPYAVSKVAQDLLGLSYVFSYQLDVVRVRPFNHIGERQTTDFAIPSFASQIAKIEKGEQDKISVGSLEAVRDFTDVKDIVKAYILLLEKGQKGEVYNVGSGKGYRMQAILAKMCSLAKVPIVIETDQSRYRPVDVPVAVANTKKIKAIGWIPSIALDQTLERVLNEWREKVNN